jgi:AraC-like DNA-binding protein
VLPLLRLAAAQGHDPQEICRNVGIAWHGLQNPDATVASEAVERLSLHVAALLGDPNLGLRTARSASDVTSFDPGLMMLMACSCLEESLQRMERLQAYWTDGARISLLPLADGLCLRHEQPAAAAASEYQRHTDEAALAKVVHGIRALTGTTARPRVVRFRHPAPADTREHQAVFGCDVRFGASHSELELSAELLKAPLPHANEAYRSIFQRQVERALASLPASSGLALDVRRAAEAALVSGRCSLASTARALGMGARTLQRRLQAEGTSFGELIDALRRELAEAYLEQELPIQEIAWQLGFAAPSAFHHAFKRWTGKTPEQARAAYAARRTG